MLSCHLLVDMIVLEGLIQLVGNSLVIKLWNNLPQNIVKSPTYTEFCNDLDTFIIAPVHYNHT